MLEPSDFAVISVFFAVSVAVSVLVLYLLLRPRRLRLPGEIGRDLEERVESLLSQFGFTYEDRRKSSVTATPDFLVGLPSGKVGLEVKNVSELSELATIHNEKVISGCKNLGTLPLYVVDMSVNYSERQGISVIPIQSLVPVLKFT